MSQETDYFVFISYSSLDSVWAVWLRHELEHYHLPASFNGRTDVRDNLRRVFRDRDELSAGPEWNKQVFKALENSKNLIVICSPHARESEPVNTEIKQFIALGKEEHIFPFIVEGNSPEECFPAALSGAKLAGDVNKDGGRDPAFIKVVAGMLNVSFPSLWERYEKEKAIEEHRAREQTDNLLRIQSRFIAERAIKLTDENNPYLAKKLLLEVLPQNLENANRPYTPEAEYALRYSDCYNFALIKLDAVNVYSSLVFHQDEKHVLCGSCNGVDIWDIAAGQLIRSIAVPCSCISPEGKRFCSQSMEIIDTETGHKLCVLDSSIGPSKSISFSCDGSMLAIAFGTSKEYTRIKVFKSDSGELVTDSNWLPISIESISFCPNSFLLALTLSDNTIRVWNYGTRKELRKLYGHTQNIHSAVFSPDGKTIASSSGDNTIRLWEIDTGEEFLRVDICTNYQSRVVFSSDGKQILAISGDSIRVWDIETRKTLIQLNGHTNLYSAFFSPDGRYIVSVSYDSIRLWLLQKELRLFKMEGCYFISYNRDGTRMATASKEGFITVRDVERGNELIKIEQGDSLCCLAFSPDNKRIASNDGYSDFSIWEIETGRKILTIKGHTHPVRYVSFRPDGKYMISASGSIEGIEYDGEIEHSDDSIRVWNAETGEELMRIKGHESRINTASYSPDGGRIVSASADRTIRIWDANSGKELLKLSGHNAGVVSAFYSIDGSRIISASCDGQVIIWDSETGAILRTIEDEGRYMSPFVTYEGYYFLSPNNKYVVGGGATIRVWDVECGKVVMKIDERVDSVVWDSDGSRIVSASVLGIKIWSFLPLQYLIDKTRECFKDSSLSQNEREKYYLS